MKKYLSLILVMLFCLPFVGCSGTYVNTGDNTGTINEIATKKPTVLGDWYCFYDDDYTILSIMDGMITVTDSVGGYVDDVICEYEDSTGYVYANLSELDLPSSVCIIPYSSNQCIITFSIDSYENYMGESYETLETFTTSHGEFYKFGHSIFKCANSIDGFRGKWEVNYDELSGENKYLGLKFDVKNKYFYDGYSFFSINNGSFLAVTNELESRIHYLFYVEKNGNELCLYEIDDCITYYGETKSVFIEQYYSEDDMPGIGYDYVFFDKNDYIKLIKTGEATPVTVFNKNATPSEKILGEWESNGTIWRFYSDYSCSPYDDTDASLHFEAWYEGQGSGRWSFVDEKLKITYHSFYGDGGGVLYHNYEFVDNDTLVIYNPLEIGKVDPIIYKRVIK